MNQLSFVELLKCQWRVYEATRRQLQISIIRSSDRLERSRAAPLRVDLHGIASRRRVVEGAITHAIYTHGDFRQPGLIKSSVVSAIFGRQSISWQRTSLYCQRVHRLPIVDTRWDAALSPANRPQLFRGRARNV